MNGSPLAPPRRPAPPRRVRAAVLLVLLAAGTVGACDSSSPGGTSGRLPVVAAEGFWGDLAGQIGGDRVRVTSIVENPATDPHSYEPSAADARAIATARLAIINGLGYDPWAARLLAASPSGRRVLEVGALLGLRSSENPHRWYSPADVSRVIAQITIELARLDPPGRAYYDRRRTRLTQVGLARYRSLIASIRSRYAGVPVGASESIFAMLAPALGLRLLTPAGFMKAIAEGTEPTAADKATVDRQIRSRQIRVWVFNRQNSTPDIARLTDEARAAGVPVVSITETPTPAGRRFQDWQASQLTDVLRALGTGAR